MADLEGASRLRPSPLSDGLTLSLTVMLANAKFLSFYCKHGTRNIQNDCHQQLSDSIRVHQIGFRPGIRPGPHWRSL